MMWKVAWETKRRDDAEGDKLGSATTYTRKATEYGHGVFSKMINHAARTYPSEGRRTSSGIASVRVAETRVVQNRRGGDRPQSAGLDYRTTVTRAVVDQNAHLLSSQKTREAKRRNFFAVCTRSGTRACSIKRSSQGVERDTAQPENGGLARSAVAIKAYWVHRATHDGTANITLGCKTFQCFAAPMMGGVGRAGGRSTSDTKRVAGLLTSNRR